MQETEKPVRTVEFLIIC